MNYTHTKEMGEISGFGGDYEECCQRMLDAAVRHLLETRPESDPKFYGRKEIYGVIVEGNDDARELSSIVKRAATEDGKHPEWGCTGAQHQAVVMRALWIKAHGWEKYKEECSKEEEKRDEHA